MSEIKLSEFTGKATVGGKEYWVEFSIANGIPRVGPHSSAIVAEPVGQLLIEGIDSAQEALVILGSVKPVAPRPSKTVAPTEAVQPKPAKPKKKPKAEKAKTVQEEIIADVKELGDALLAEEASGAVVVEPAAQVPETLAEEFPEDLPEVEIPAKVANAKQLKAVVEYYRELGMTTGAQIAAEVAPFKDRVQLILRATNFEKRVDRILTMLEAS